MRVKSLTLQAGGAADDDAFAAAQNPVAQTPLTLTAAAAAISPPREVTLTSAGDLSAITFTIEGVDRYGQKISEQLAGPNNETVRSSKVYSKITAITPSASNGSAQVEVGYPARVCSPWIIAGGMRGDEELPTAMVQAIAVPGQAFATAVVERTMENFMRIPGEGATPAASPAQLNSDGAVVTVQGTALRVVVTAETGAIKVAIARPGY